MFEPLIVIALIMPKETASAQISFSGISSCHFRSFVTVHNMGSIPVYVASFIWGEALLKDPDSLFTLNWYGGSIMFEGHWQSHNTT